MALRRPALAQGAVKSVHKDWQIRCDTPPGAKAEQCALIQSVTAEDRANVGLTVIVLKTADQKSRLMRVVAPLGVLLPSGLGLKIDNADIGRAGFVRCLPNGCIAEVVMDDNLIDKLRTGKSATFIIFQTPEEGIGFPMSLQASAKATTSCRSARAPACRLQPQPGLVPVRSTSLSCADEQRGWPRERGERRATSVLSAWARWAQLIVPRLMAAGHKVTGWNRSRDKAEPLIAAGMRWADTPRAVARSLRDRVLDRHRRRSGARGRARAGRHRRRACARAASTST